ncbi:MAG: OsmC family protein [Nitrospinae bacterium]|nr:OsmC family protein [Nitrospinota bacterium]
MTDRIDLTDYKTKTASTLKSTLRWGHELVFQGRTQRGYELDFDAAMEWGCSPTEALLLSFAGCMAIDIVSILRKQRVELTEFHVDISADRNPTPPQYFTAMTLDLKLKGHGLDDAKVQRAIGLSQEKYCSVRHTLRPDLKITINTILENEPPHEQEPA